MRAAILGVVILASPAFGQELVSIRPGVMCVEPSALAALTRPDGSSRSEGPEADVKYKQVAREGGCLSFSPSMKVTRLEAHRQTSIVRPEGADASQSYVVPNIDFVASNDGGGTTTSASNGSADNAPPASGTSAENGAATSTESDLTMSNMTMLTDMEAALVYGKLTDQKPDFETLAEQSPEYKAANAFDRKVVLDRLVEQYERMYSALPADRTYRISTQMNLGPFDPQSIAFRLDWSIGTYIKFSDPTNNDGIELTLSNMADFASIRFGSTDSARSFATEHGLSQNADQSDSVIFDAVVQIDSAPAAINRGEEPLKATILRAQLRDSEGHLVYRFPASSSPGAVVSSPPSLQGAASDIQGLHIGMTFEAADKIGKSKFTTASSSPGLQGIYLNGFKQDHDFVRCGDINTEMPEQMVAVGRSSLEGPDRDFTECVAFRVDQTSSEGKIKEIITQQYIVSSPGQVANALIAKYGTPSRQAGSSQSIANSNGHELTWVNREAQTGGLVKIVADEWKDGEDQTLLYVDIQPYVDPNAKVAPARVGNMEGPHL